MSATAFQRMRREAAAKKAAAVSKEAEKECDAITENVSDETEESDKADALAEEAEAEEEPVKSKRTRKK